MWPFPKKPPKPSAPRGQKQHGTAVLIREGDHFSLLLSVLEDVFEGLPGEAVAGIIKSPCTEEEVTKAEKISFENFKPNRVFSEFMHNTIRAFGPANEDLQKEARQIGDGWVYVIDMRTPEFPFGEVPPEDIIGRFETKDGSIGAYEPNPNHRIYTTNGLVQLHPELKAIHIRELKSLAKQAALREP